MANTNSVGLPINLFPQYPDAGATITEVKYTRLNALVINPTTKVLGIEYNESVTGALDLDATATASEFLQMFEWVRQWAEQNPADVTPALTRFVNILAKLRQATPTDTPYDAYELLVFWKAAIYPEQFAPVVLTDSVLNTWIMLALGYDHAQLYARVTNDINRTIDPNTPIVTPPTGGSGTGGTGTGGTPTNPANPIPATIKTTNYWWIVAFIVLVAIIFYFSKP